MFLKTFNNNLNDFTKAADSIIRSPRDYFQLTFVEEPSKEKSPPH